MMMRLSTALGVGMSLMAGAALSLNAAGSAPQRDALLQDEAVSFFVPFENSSQPEIARSDSSPVATGGEAFEEGRVGTALTFPEGELSDVSFPIGDNLSLKAGTIMFWFKPLWSGQDPKGRYTLLWVTMKGSDKYLAIHRSFSADNPLALYFNLQWDAVVQSSTEPYFHAGEWVHVALTWGEGRFKVYIDGKVIGESAWPDTSSDASYVPDVLKLGAYYRGENEDSPINASYDEFFIFQRALSGPEIAAYIVETKP